MIFPSVYVTPNGETAAVVELLTDTTGLQRWVDYIPVQFAIADDTPTNEFANNGAILVDVLLSTSGLVAGSDYLRIYEDVSTAIEWSTDLDGYIPVYKHQDWTEDNLELETGFNLLQETGEPIILES